MFTVLSLRNSYPLSADQRAYLMELLDAYALTEGGSWLNYVGYKDFAFKWCDKMNLDNGIMGAFSPLYKNTIFMLPDSNKAFQDQACSHFWVQLLFPTVVHQLRHAWQYQTMGLLYTLACLPIVRELTIQVAADLQTNAAQEWVHAYSLRKGA